MILKNVYVSLVPLWLADRVNDGSVPVDALTSYSRLSSIISVNDVCFYHQYNVNAGLYQPESVSDLINVSSKHENIDWITNNANANKSIMQMFTHSIAAAKDDLSSSSVSLAVKKCPFEPQHTNAECLVLLATRAGEHQQNNFEESCLTALAKMFPASQFKELELFKSFCRA